MNNSAKIFLFIFVMAATIFILKPWETSDELVIENPQDSQAATHPPKARGSRSPASIGNPGEASALSVRE